MFTNGEITFYNDGWKIVIKLYDLELDDIKGIHNRINSGYDKIKWKTFQYDDKLWYSNNSKAIRVIEKNDDTKTICFQKALWF